MEEGSDHTCWGSEPLLVASAGSTGKQRDCSKASVPGHGAGESGEKGYFTSSGEGGEEW